MNLENKDLKKDSLQNASIIIDDSLSLNEFWQQIIEYKKIIFLIIFLAIIISYIIAILSTPIYRAEALLAPIGKESSASGFASVANQLGGLASLAGISLGKGDSKIEVIIATLKSREFTNKFIKENNLLPILFQDKWDKKNRQWIAGKKSPTLWDGYKLFNNSVRVVKVDKGTGLITLIIEWRDPVLAARWVEDLISRINELLRTEAIHESVKSIEYLKAELDRTSVIEIKRSIYGLIEAQTKKMMLANTRKDFAFRVIDPAVAPEEMIRPKRALIVFFGLIIGFVTSFVTIFLLITIRKQKRI